MNLEALAEQSGLEMDEIELIAQVFATSAREALTRLENARAAGDDEAALFALHKIAGSSAAILGLGEINRLAKVGEEALKSGRKPDLTQIKTQIEELLLKAQIP